MRILRPSTLSAAANAVFLFAFSMIGRSNAWSVSPLSAAVVSRESFRATPSASHVCRIPGGLAGRRSNKERTWRRAASHIFLRRSVGDVVRRESNDWTEFDMLLHEESSHGGSSAATNDAIVSATSNSRRQVVQLGGRASTGDGVVVLSSAAIQSESLEDATDTSASGEYDPYASDMDYQQSRQQLGKIHHQQQNAAASLDSRFQKMDLQDIIITLIIPGILSFVSLRWGFNQVASRLSTNADVLLDGFAREMIHHDGDFDEMRMCHADYSRQLVWMGPGKGDAMLKRYLAAYAKKKTVSPQAISTLSYVFTLFKLSEERAAQVLISLCEEMGEGKISSAGKILFFGSRIIKSNEGKAALEPIKNLIKSTYRDEEVAETLVETSQQAIGEAAYRSTVLEAGKGQHSLTAGWDILGLDKATATRIFEAESEEGFLTDRESMYGGQSRKYDKKGRLLDDEGKLQDRTEAEGDEDEDDSDSAAPATNVYSCSECGYTLFIAKGREFKFYGDDFKCPECGAGKEKFNPADIKED